MRWNLLADYAEWNSHFEAATTAHRHHDSLYNLEALLKNVIWFAVFSLGTAVLIVSPLLLTRLTLPPTTPGVEVEKEIERLAEVVTNAQIALQQAKQEAQTIRSIRTKRSHSAPMPLKSYQDNDLIVAKTF